MRIFQGVCCAFLSLAVVGCTPPAARQNAPAQQAEPIHWRYFDGNDCVGDAGNCLPDVIVTPNVRAQVDALAELDAAVAAGSTTAYFGSDRWQALLPALKLAPRHLEVLRSGIPVVRVDRPNGKRFYIATKLSKEELTRRIETAGKGKRIEGIEVCMPFVVK